MENKLLLPAALMNFRPKVDGSYSLNFGTYILSEEQKIQIMRMHNHSGVLLFSDKETHSAADINMIDAIDVDMGNTKTPSQRLRSVIYLYYEQQNSKDAVTFKEFYINQMERMINYYKDKLEG
jgi:hypothetical protein